MESKKKKKCNKTAEIFPPPKKAIAAIIYLKY